MQWENCSTSDTNIVTSQINRSPRNLLGIVRRCAQDCPQVIINHPLPQSQSDTYFFPTLFWLTCPETIRRIGELENRGIIEKMQTQINSDLHLAQQKEEAHL